MRSTVGMVDLVLWTLLNGGALVTGFVLLYSGKTSRDALVETFIAGLAGASNSTSI